MVNDKLNAVLRNPPEVLKRLAGVDGLYLVGGYLRDACWGLPTRDIDLTAAAPLEPVVAELDRRLGGAAFELNNRFNSYRLVLDDYELDLSPLHPDGLAADLARRDYTINALVYPVAALGPRAEASSLLADHRTLADLDARILRMVSVENLADDPVRLLRGLRLLATRGLQLDPATEQALAELSGHLLESAPERLHEELLRWFGADADIVPVIETAAETGLLWQLFPKLQATAGCKQNDFHHLDVWQHTLLALRELAQLRRELPPELAAWRAELAAAWDMPVSGAATAGALIRLALLLHDIGKPPAREVQPDGHVSFYAHQSIGAELAGEQLARLKFAGAETEFMLTQIRQHLRLGFYSDHDPIPPRLVYRYMRHLGAGVPLAVLHALADCAATQGEANADGWERHVRAAAELLQNYYDQSTAAAPPALLDGHAIMRLLEIKPGPLVGELKNDLLEATAAGEVADVATAEEYIRARYAEL